MYRQSLNKVSRSGKEDDLDFDLVMDERTIDEDQNDPTKRLIVPTIAGFVPRTPYRSGKITPENFRRRINRDNYDPNYGRDLCPVCVADFLDSNQKYCSKTCQKIAHLFRRRLSGDVKKLRGLGFDCEYTNGVQLRITLPEELWKMFPEGCRTLHCPTTSYDMERLHGGHLYPELRMLLGKYLGHYLEVLVTKDVFSPNLMRELYVSYAVFTATLPDATFTCDACGGTYIKAPYSYSEGDGHCENCTADSIPF